MDEPTLLIGEVARRAGIKTSAIRYYEDEGLLPAAERVNGRRHYSPSILRRLAVIDVAQRAGLSLAEIRELVDAGNDPLSPHLRALAERKLPEIDALVERAQRVRAWMQTATGCGCETIDECGLFDDPALPERDTARGLTVITVGSDR